MVWAIKDTLVAQLSVDVPLTERTPRVKIYREDSSCQPGACSGMARLGLGEASQGLSLTQMVGPAGYP